MSVQLTDRILEADIPSRTTKLVMLKLAKHASAEGLRIFPSVATIAKAAQCSPRQAQRILHDLRSAGILLCLREGGGGPGRTTEYAFNLQALDALVAEGWDRFRSGPAPAAKQPVAHDLDAQPEVYDAMASYTSSRSAKGDTGCHPNSQEEGSRVEKERARTATDFSDPSSPPVRHASRGRSDDPSFGTFLATWPYGVASNRTRALNAWQRLTEAERQAALAGIAPFLASWAAAGRTYALAGETYLSEKRWLLAAPAQAQSPSMPMVDAWSQDWWRVVLRRLEAGTKVGFAFTEARSGRALTVGLDELAAARAAFPRLHQVDPEAIEARAWQAWLERQGARLPDVDQAYSIFIPSAAPPQSGPRR